MHMHIGVSGSRDRDRVKDETGKRKAETNRKREGAIQRHSNSRREGTRGGEGREERTEETETKEEEQ